MGGASGRVTSPRRVRKSLSSWQTRSHSTTRESLSPHSGVRVETFLTGWLDDVKPTIRPRTYESYELPVRHHINPEVGSVRLSGLRPEHIRPLLKRKLDIGLSSQTVVHTRTALNTPLRQAIGDRLLSWNRVSSVKPPKVRRRAYSQFTADQARAFLKAAENTWLGAAFAIRLSLGLRCGEVLGPRWSDVDLEKLSLRVEQTIQRIRAKVGGSLDSWSVSPRPNDHAERWSCRRSLSLCSGVIGPAGGRTAGGWHGLE
jgi:integrase